MIMHPRNNKLRLQTISGLCILLVVILFGASCSDREISNQPDTIVHNASNGVSDSYIVDQSATGPKIANGNNQIEIDNKHYLFDVTEHTIEELQDLLERIAEVTEASPEAFNQLKIVMVLHGPDIDLFTQKNYEVNKSVVDLAAKLDAFDIVDMKVCETAINNLGFNRNDIPAFIESVPYAPDTIRNLKQQGYINL